MKQKIKEEMIIERLDKIKVLLKWILSCLILIALGVLL